MRRVFSNRLIAAAVYSPAPRAANARPVAPRPGSTDDTPLPVDSSPATNTSRFGLWGFDLAQTQLMQELVEHEYAGAVNGAQETIVNVCYLVSYGYTMVFSDPRHFIWPVVFSYLSILASGVLFTRYWRVTGDATPKIPHRASSPTSGGEILPLTTTATTTSAKQQGEHDSSSGGVTASGDNATAAKATAVQIQRQGPHAAASGSAADEGAHSV